MSLVLRSGNPVICWIGTLAVLYWSSQENRKNSNAVDSEMRLFLFNAAIYSVTSATNHRLFSAKRKFNTSRVVRALLILPNIRVWATCPCGLPGHGGL